MQQFWVLAATWLLSWIDRRTESGVAQVFCNCTCEVQPVHCEVTSWSFEALKACLWVLFGLTIGLGKLTLGILYWLWEQLLITLHSRTLSDSDPSAVGAAPSQPIRAISGGVPRGPQPAPDRLGGAPHEPNRGRALEQLALIRQRREGVAAGN